jgi:hypothetical protein
LPGAGREYATSQQSFYRFIHQEQTMVASNKTRQITFGVGDEISYAFGKGMAYGEVLRVLEGGQAIEIQFEDGRREIKKARDGALRLLRRATGASELEEANRHRGRSQDIDISEVMRGDIRRRK